MQIYYQSGHELVDDDDIAKITFSATTGEIIKTVEYKVPQYDSNGEIIPAGTVKVLSGKEAILDLLTEENVEWFTATQDFEQETGVELNSETRNAILEYIKRVDDLIVDKTKKSTEQSITFALNEVIEELRNSKDFPEMGKDLTNPDSKTTSQKAQIGEMASELRVSSFFAFLEALNDRIRSNGDKEVDK